MVESTTVSRQLLRTIQVIFLMLSGAGTFGQEINLPEQNDRWIIQPDGSIEWKIDQRVPHFDHIEMDGEKVALWIQYGVDSRAKPKLSGTIVFPPFKLLPVRTIAHMMYNVKCIVKNKIDMLWVIGFRAYAGDEIFAFEGLYKLLNGLTANEKPA